MFNQYLVTQTGALAIRLRRTVLFVIAYLSACGSAHANSFDLESLSGWVLGGAYSSTNQLLTGNEQSSHLFLPLLGYQGDQFKWLGTSLSYRLSDTDNVKISATADVRFSAVVADSENVALAGLTEREDTVELGIMAEVGYLSFFTNHDFLDIHGAYSIGMGLGNRWELSSKLSLEAGVGAVWQHKDITRYYFGVSMAEATTDRSMYLPESAINYNAGFQLSYTITPKTVVSVGAGYLSLDSEIRDSPIIDASSQTVFVAGIVYQLSN